MEVKTFAIHSFIHAISGLILGT